MSNQNGNQPKTRPAAADKSLDDVFPNRFIKAEDLIKVGATSISVTIDHVNEEEVTPKPGAPAEWKLVIYFRTRKGILWPQGYLLSAKVDRDSLKTATGATTVGGLTGKAITIHIDEYKRESVLRISPQPVPTAFVQRFYPQMRMYGGDAAVPLKPFTVKAEAAYFTSSTPQAGDYALYVLQLERMYGEWTFVGGYAGEVTTTARTAADFAPDRGLARAFLGRASYTIDTNRSLGFEAAVRQNGKGVWLKSEYSQAIGQHWRATAAFTLIRGDPTDFLGQYRLNSHALLAIRYSF